MSFPNSATKLSLFTLMILTVFFMHVHSVFAASTIMNLSPNNGIYGKPFTVDLVIDGHGDVFNAAQAIVSISPNLSIQDLVLGDCNFSSLGTPSLANPSFQGVILGGSSKKCTVYTLTLAPTEKGTGTIVISKASVRRFGDAANVLLSSQNGTYTITGVTKTNTNSREIPTITPPKNNLYTVVLTLSDTKKTPIKNTTVELKSVVDKKPMKTKTDAKGTVLFTNLHPGIYDAIAAKDQGERILNVSGNNHVLVLGMTLQPKPSSLMKKLQIIQNSPFVMGGLLILGMVLGISIFALIIKLKTMKKQS